MTNKKAVEIVFIMAICFLVTPFLQAKVSDNIVTAEVGDMDFEFRRGKGVKLSVGGTVIISGSSNSIVSPGWVEKYFLTAYEKRLNASVQDYKGGKKIVLELDSKGIVTGRRIFTLLPDNTFIVELDFEYKSDKPALFEGHIGFINPLPIIGCTYNVRSGQQKSEGVIPLIPKGRGRDESMVAEDFEKLTINSRLGNISVIPEFGSEMQFFDYRNNRWADKNNPAFWLGYPGKEIGADGKINCKVRMKFPEVIETSRDVKNIRIEVPLEKIPDARVAEYEQNYILPTPKKATYTKDEFLAETGIKIFVSDEAGCKLQNGIDFFIKDMVHYYRIRPKVIEKKFAADSDNMVIITNKTKAPAITDYPEIAVPKSSQGYGLQVDANSIIIASIDEEGACNGLMTLLQLSEFRSGRLRFKGARIYDYPALQTRGLHFFTGKNAEDQISRVIRDLMARYKMNTLLWQCDYLEWDCTEDIHHESYGMSKDSAAEVIRTAEENNIEIIPLIPTLGHSEWIFHNNRNLDLAEDPQNPYAYCPTNEETYDFIFEVFEEAVDFFQPKRFHIGHDEVTMQGRFPYRSKGESVTDLFIKDITKIHKWFSEKNIKIGMWGDMLIAPEEASSSAFAPNKRESEKRRQLLPDDITVYDWHYEINDADKFKSLELFRKEGFDTIASVWFKPGNIAPMAKAAADNNSEGLIGTTWAGYNFDIDNNVKNWFQYWAYLWGAEYAWTGQDTPADELSFTAPDLFRNIWLGKKPLTEDKPGYCFDLRDLYNIKLSDTESSPGWLGFGGGMDLSSFPTDKNTFGNTRFFVEENNKNQAAVLMNGTLNPDGNYPGSLTIEADKIKTNQVRFLYTCAFKTADKTSIGKITFNYVDTSSTETDLVYGENIFSYRDIRVTPEVGIAWKGESANGEQICVNEFCWSNPYPDKKLESITITSAPQTESAIILFAVTSVI